MAPDQSQSDRTAVGVVGLLRRGCWAAVPIGTIESLIDGGRVVDFPSGGTVYTEADAEQTGRRDARPAARLHARRRRPPGHRALRSSRRSAGCAGADCRTRTGLRAGGDVRQLRSSSTSIASNARRGTMRRWRGRSRRNRFIGCTTSWKSSPETRSRRSASASHATSSTSRASRPEASRTLTAIGESAGSREQRRFGPRSGRACPRRTSGGTPRPNVARPRGDSRSRTDEPTSCGRAHVTKVTAPEKQGRHNQSRGHQLMGLGLKVTCLLSTMPPPRF